MRECLRASNWQLTEDTKELNYNTNIVEGLVDTKINIDATKGLLKQVNHLLSGDIVVCFIHVYTKTNRCADAMSKMSFFHQTVNI